MIHSAIPGAARSRIPSRGRETSRLLCCAALCLWLWGLLTAPARAATLEIVPSDTLIKPWQGLTVEVFVSGLGNLSAPSLGAYDLTLNFNPMALRYTVTTIDTALGDPGAGQAIVGMLPGAANVSIFAVSLRSPAVLDASQADRFRLFSVTFDSRATGVAGLGLTVTALGDELGAPLPVDDIVEPPVVVIAGSGPGSGSGTGKTAIPTLSAWGLLLMMGLLAAPGLHRYRCRARRS